MALKTLVYMRTREVSQNVGLHENVRWLSKHLYEKKRWLSNL